MAETDSIYARMEAQYFGSDMHEKAEIENLPDLLTGVRTFVDVGCSLGQYSYYAGKVLRDAVFYCIEPDDFKVRRLRELAATWEKETGNQFHVINKAVSDINGVAKFFVPRDHRSSGAFFPLQGDGRNPSEWEEFETECITLDSLLDGKDIDFMKIDVEGGEYRVLLGARKILEAGRVKVLMEVAPWGDLERSYRPSDIFNLMSRFGYDFKIFQNHYLFHRTNRKAIGRVRCLLMGFILNHASIKNIMKKLLASKRRLVSGFK